MRDDASQLDVLIVHYRTPDLLKGCLSRLLADGAVAAGQILVIDNAPESGAAEWRGGEFAAVETVVNSGNIGFARAVNRGLARLKAPYVLLLNPDAALAGGDALKLAEFLKQNPKAAAVTPVLLGEDGKPQDCYSAFPTLARQIASLTGIKALFPETFRARFRSKRDGAPGALRVDWAIGACLALKREAVDGVGGLDEDFVLCGEDLDLCYRLGKAGWSVCILKDIEVRHVGSPRDHMRSGLCRELLVHWTTRMFFRKHRGAAAAFLLDCVQRGVSILRFAAHAGRYLLSIGGCQEARLKMRIHALCIRKPDPFRSGDFDLKPE